MNVCSMWVLNVIADSLEPWNKIPQAAERYFLID